jgi:hypothetical protein
VPKLATLARRRHKLAKDTLIFVDFLFLGHKKGNKKLIVCFSVDSLITYYIGIILRL